MTILTVLSLVARFWKVGVAALVVLALTGYAIHLDRAGYQRRVNEDKAQEIALLHERIAKIGLITSLDTQRAQADATLTKQLESLAFETPPNAGACLDRAAASRVRAIQLPDPFAATAPTRRHPSLFQKRS